MSKINRTRVIAFAAVALFVTTLSIGMFGQLVPRASAAVDWATTLTNTQKYSLYKAFSDCLASPKTTSVTPQLIPADSLVLAPHAISGNASSALLITSATVPVGLANLPINNSLAKDGNMECNYIADAFADMVGSRDELLRALGYTEVLKPTHVWNLNSAYVTTGTTTGTAGSTQVTTVNKQPIIANFTAYAASKNIPTSADQYMQYELFFQAFTLGNGVACGVGDFQLASTAGSSDQRTDKLKFYNIGYAKYDTYLYTQGTASPSTSLKVVPGDTTAYSCDAIRTELESRSVTIASTIASQDMQAATTAAAKVYANGTSTTSGLCSAYGTGTGDSATEYNNCVAAIESCLQPVTLGVATYTYADMSADIFSACFSKKVNMKPADIIKTYTALQAQAVAAGSGTITQGDPCAANPNGNDANGKSCKATSTDPCAAIPADTAMPWLACSIFTAVNAMVKAMSGLMVSILHTNTDTFFSNNLRNTSNVFRNLALTLIIIAGLVMVIAQATGTDLIDAYTVKKVLPKLGVAVVGIALSWPLLKFGVGLSNDLGGIVGNLFDKIADAGTTAGGVSTGVDNFVGLIATVSAGGAVTAVVGFWGAILLFLSLLISYITGLIVLLMQKLLLVVLVVAAPLAIASYVLPGTEKLWKLWKSNFFKVIILYFVIMVIVKIGDVLAAVIIQGGLSGTNDGATTVLAILAKITTLILTFKAPQLSGQILGGVVGMVSGAAYKMAGGLKAPLDKARQQSTAQYQQHYKDLASQKALQTRYNGWNNLKDSNGIVAKMARRAIGGHNIEAEVSAHNAKYAEAMDRQIATGPDSLIRAYSIDKSVSESRLDKNGNKEFKSLGGAWFKESMVDDAQKAFGSKNAAAFQKSLTYEMQKALTQEDQDNIINNYGGVARARGFNNTELGEMWTGSAFAKQNENRQWKHYSWDDQKNGTSKARMKGVNLMREIDEKQGNYAMMQQNADTWTTMGAEMQHAHDVLNGKAARRIDENGVMETDESLKEILERGSRIAFATKSASMATVPASAVAGGDSGAQGGSAQTIGGREIGAGAAGRVQQEMMAFVQIADSLTGGGDHHYDATSNMGHFGGDASGATQLSGQGSRRAGQGDIGARKGTR